MIKEKNILQNNPKSSLTKIQRKISTTQIILIVSLSLVLAVVGILINIRFQRERIDKNLQNISETIATSPILKNNDFQSGTATEQESLMDYLDSLKKSLYDVDVISIVNSENIRFYHTNHSLIGTEYDGETPNLSSDKTFYIVNTNGPSGAQRRAYSALYSSDGQYIGFIMVIILTEHVNASFRPILITYSIITLIVTSDSKSNHIRSYRRSEIIVQTVRDEKFLLFLKIFPLPI